MGLRGTRVNAQAIFEGRESREDVLVVCLNLIYNLKHFFLNET